MILFVSIAAILIFEEGNRVPGFPIERFRFQECALFGNTKVHYEPCVNYAYFSDSTTKY